MNRIPTTGRFGPTFAIVNWMILLAVVGCIRSDGPVLRDGQLSRTAVKAGFVLWRGEILFAQPTKRSHPNRRNPSEFMAINPDTGIVRKTGMVASCRHYFPGYVNGIVARTDKLWITLGQELQELDTDLDSVKDCGFSFGIPVSCTPFLLDGKLTSIQTDQQYRVYLCTLIDGKWQRERRILWPRAGRTLVHDPESGQLRLVPLGGGDCGGLCPDFWVKATQIGNEVHVVATGHGPGPKHWVYRVGFDFVPGEDVPSAIAPANDEPESTGWYLLDKRISDKNPVPCNICGEFFLCTSNPPTLWKANRSKPGSFTPAYSEIAGSDDTIHVVQSVRTDTTYVVTTSPSQSMKLFRFQDSHYERLPICDDDAPSQ